MLLGHEELLQLFVSGLRLLLKLGGLDAGLRDAEGRELEIGGEPIGV
jgi:hypothetical protein